MRRAIRALPQGAFESEMTLSGVAGYTLPVRLALRATIRDGGIRLDYAGTGGQIPRAINVTLNMTRLIWMRTWSRWAWARNKWLKDL